MGSFTCEVFTADYDYISIEVKFAAVGRKANKILIPFHRFLAPVAHQQVTSPKFTNLFLISKF